jgi:hypothetical protein
MTQNKQFDFNALSTNQKGVLGAAAGMLLGIFLPFFGGEQDFSIWDFLNGDFDGVPPKFAFIIMDLFSHVFHAFLGVLAFAGLTYLTQFKGKAFHLYIWISALVTLISLLTAIWYIGAMTDDDKSLTSLLGIGAYLLLASSAAGIYFSRKD